MKMNLYNHLQRNRNRGPKKHMLQMFNSLF
jgi:hypothetical protein